MDFSRHRAFGHRHQSEKPPQTVEMLRWAAGQLRSGHRLFVPAIADYEVRRELIRLGRSAGLRSLDTWNGAASDRYMEFTDAALKRAAALWADARNQGVVTADPKELDCDALIAAQVIEYQQTYALELLEIVVATTNVGHLSRFVPAQLWSNIA